jgi:hypothetical protein
MNDSVEAKIIKLHLHCYRQNEITAALHNSEIRVSLPIRHFHEISLLPDALRVGCPNKVASELASYTEVRTTQEPLVSGGSLSVKISDEFDVLPSSRTALEDEQLLHNYFTWRLKWKRFAKSWGITSVL